ncbi:MAG TPA: family 1 glycosylhydrolase [Polyangiaceae bacterium]|nr:family 1 glycosylhydrolase [Polyangiaceae bacterium]
MKTSEIELWGGIECTVNRVGDTFFDQVERTGHAGRLDDLDRLAALGTRALRFPILWERTARSGLGSFDFAWADARMQRLRELGIRPIVGLVHHGSGPRGTSLLEESFVEGLAEFAQAVAERYPWVEDYTPVNEPLTTARFSALYGHWYPHARDSRSFLRALLVQTRAVAASMQAIRSVTPQARLIQTEDFASVFGSPRLKYQVDFENHRKWLSMDLLFGRVTPRHPLYRYLLDQGVDAEQLRKVVEQPCPPDIVGVNYYVTSDRFLDDGVSRYPVSAIGSNGRDQYADVEAVRVRRKGIVGHRAVLLSCWARYKTPLAITEAHLGCTPEEQVRWLNEAWQGARAARAAGADVRAVTLWSVFGAYDWDSLVTKARGHYEPGAFDIRGPRPQPTALAHVAKELAENGQSRHPLLVAPGWWRRPERLVYRPSAARKATRSASPSQVQPILITGGGGALAEAFRKVCEERGLIAHTLSRAELDIADAASVEAVLGRVEPWLVVNAAGVPWSEEGADQAERCYRANVEGPRLLAHWCRDHGTRLLTFSSALVFDGRKECPYVESDPLSPTTVLGLSHASAERLILDSYSEALVVRSGTIFSAAPSAGRLWDALRRLQRGEAVPASAELFWSLAFAPDLAHTCLDLAIAHVTGTVHLAHQDAPSIFDFLRDFAHAMSIDPKGLVPASREQCRISARLPQRATLASVRVPPLASLEAVLARLSHDVGVQRHESPDRAA